MSVISGLPARTLSIRSPAIGEIAGRPVLEPVRLNGREGVNSLFEYTLLVKTPDALNADAGGAANFNLDDFVGRELGCAIALDGTGEFLPGAVGASVDHLGAGIRQINALITKAEFWGQEGRHAQYRLTLRPWLHLATLRTNTRTWQNQTVVEILDELLGAYAFPVHKLLFAPYPVRDFQVQYNESDFDFFCRITQEWGINYFFEHVEGKHRLVLTDAMAGYLPQDSEAYRTVQYHVPGVRTDAEHLHRFVPLNQLTSGRYTSRDHDYQRPRSDLSAGASNPRPTGQADQEVYQWHAPHGGSHYAQPAAGTQPGNPPPEGDMLALLRMQALRTHGSRATAAGNLRGMVPGRTFTLARHVRQGLNVEYLVLDTRFLIEDVARDSQIPDAHADRKQQWRTEVDFTAHPVTEELRPALTRRKPIAQSGQVALVVGPAGQNLWTDALGRIKVQFPWDRLGSSDADSSCWVRVSNSWAGNQLGDTHVPRIGQEVIVDFIGGDPDLPIVTGRHYNAMNLPPWSLPGQSALSGVRSRELTGGGGNSAAGRSNHLVFDDTPSAIQVQLKSDHQSSSLSLGSITRIEDNAGRKDARGEGFELRTDGHGVVRAGDGLLISTEARVNAQAHAKDMGETTTRLKTAQGQHEGLAKAAATAKAQQGGQDQAEVAKAIEAQNKAIKGSEGKFPELQEPHLVLASAAGIAATTPESIHLQAGEHIAMTAEGHISLSAGQSWFVSAKDGIRQFALRNGIKWVAGKQRVKIEAHKDRINLTAREAVRITSTHDTITISAPRKVTVNGGGSFTEWSATGILHGTLGGWVEHAAVHYQVGPDSRQLESQSFSRGDITSKEADNKNKNNGGFYQSL